MLSRLYDPSSPDYHHFLSVAQFADQFGPTPEDYQALVDFAEANGFTVSNKPANRLIVPITGTASQVESALHVRMNNYHHPTENRTFYSPDREPSLNLMAPIAHITGLNNYSIPRPLVKKASANQGPVNASVIGAGPGGSHLASDMRAAYYTSTVPTTSTALTGSGQTVGLVELTAMTSAMLRRVLTGQPHRPRAEAITFWPTPRSLGERPTASLSTTCCWTAPAGRLASKPPAPAMIRKRH